ncbi:MAG: patatin-like phospholipase family protein [Acetatifactor sp.]|nr:patatin-like phospholipase family protein [Acetatifactor sp.]
MDGLVEQGILQEPGMQRTGVRKGIGLVLVGGGGRGAYHIGVWKALEYSGLKQYVSSVSGTSVGGLNAALFLQGDLEKAQHIWENISRDDILTPHNGHGRDSGHANYGMGLFSRSGLRKIIKENLDMDVFDTSEMECYMTGSRIGGKKDMESYTEMFTCPDGMKRYKKYVDGKATYFNLRGFSWEEREKILLATSAMPVIFPAQKIGTREYIDGGIADNVPVEPLYVLEKCKIIVIVHITTNDGNRNYTEKFPGAKILQIRPQNEQGEFFTGILDFTAEGAKRRIGEGYNDNIEMFLNIKKEIDKEKEFNEHIQDELQNVKEIGLEVRNGAWGMAEMMNRLEKNGHGGSIKDVRIR